MLTREGSRPHRFAVTSYDGNLVALGTEFVDLADEPVRLPAAAVVVPNSGGETFARLRLDPRSWELLARDLASVAEEDVRAIVWSTAMDLVRCGELPPEEFLGLVTRHLPRERHIGIAEAVLGWTLGTLVVRHLPPEASVDAVTQVAAACESALASEPDEMLAISLTRVLARTTPDSMLLQRWLVDRVTHTGIEVDQHLRWLAVIRLAALGELTAEEIGDERAGDGTIQGVLGAAEALAARPDADAKAAAFERLLGEPPLSNREFEATAAGLFDPEQAALVAPYVERYLTEGLEPGPPPRPELRGAGGQRVPHRAVHRRPGRAAGPHAGGRRPDGPAAGVGGRLRRPGDGPARRLSEVNFPLTASVVRVVRWPSRVRLVRRSASQGGRAKACLCAERTSSEDNAARCPPGGSD